MFIERQSSIATKLMRMNMLVSAAALVLACAAFVGYDYVVFMRSMVRVLSVQAQIIGANSASALLFNDPRSAGNTLAALSVAPNIIEAAIFTPPDKAFAAYSRRASHATFRLPEIPAAQTEAHWFKGGSLTLARKISFQGRSLGTVLIRSDLSPIDDRMKGYVLICAFVLTACMAAAVAASSFSRRSIATPVVRLAETARLISQEKDYSLRIAAGAARDEIGVLLRSFNDMLEQIQARDRELLEAHDQLESRVEERTAQLQAANKELEAFSYSVSHDLRAPLRQVHGFASILMDEYGSRLDSECHRYLGLIQKGARTMGQLIDELINMGRISRQDLVRRPTPLNDLVQYVLNNLETEIGGRSIDFRIGALPTVECDPGLIKQAFVNLLSNAVKYTRHQKQPVIEVAKLEENGETVICVRDNGAGFDQKYAHKLFGVFQRLHRAEEFEGTGVGLATVRRIIENHGGRIWAQGEPGKGAAFYFTLKPCSVTRHSRAS